ncbi:Lipid A export ATP-binding/permease protein MsbA [Lacunisphaera limnophila]|uniref:Lipid A export ATP-binding/permease protein MsbA n=1 Tax=Lacunisphaera limnophila TaxID=1838286 RepID=A0A1D8AVG3_9BACT|nr:ABC transporter ATP-binding protein [Lacunisphaera limnophila]AOS44887.1 Lipid A export ATP-binding/permease protein MsbA [Lacunisphaera limnophila]
MLRRFRPYFHYLREHRSLLLLGILCGVISGIATGAGLPLMVDRVFPVVFGANAAPLSNWQLAVVVLWLPLVFTLRGVFGYLNAYLIQLAGTRVLESIRRDFFRKLQVLPLSFFGRHSSGDLISRGLADANQLQFTLTTVANEIVKSPATLVGAIGVIAYKAYQIDGLSLVLVCLAAVPLTVLPIRHIGKKLARRSGSIQRELGAVSSRFNENLAAAREIRAFGLEDRETARFSLVTRALITAQMKFVKYEKALAPMIEIISTLGIAGTLLYAYRIHLDLPTFMALITALYASYEPVKRLGALNNETKRGLGALDRLEAILNEPVTIKDPPQPVPVSRLRGEIAFSGVTFAYGDSPALSDVTVTIPAGTVCALVGPSGAGKSTFANLVPRFYEVGAGAVTIDGIDVRQMKLADLRRHIALVSQEPVLFNDTIYENLRLGREGATRDEIMAAAVDAHADEFIRQLPLGYETIVGERGALLSGGQKQRVAIARAFLRHAPILILDEATSALDSDSEAAVQDALRKLVQGKTVLIIAHRFSTIRDASQILVFDRGRIAASGDHTALYAGNALYKSLYDRQSAHGAQ